MIALNIIFMTAVFVGLVSLLAAGIVKDHRHRSRRAAEISPAAAPLTRNLEMPREAISHSARTHRALAAAHQSLERDSRPRAATEPAQSRV